MAEFNYMQHTVGGILSVGVIFHNCGIPTALIINAKLVVNYKSVLLLNITDGVCTEIIYRCICFSCPVLVMLYQLGKASYGSQDNHTSTTLPGCR